MVPEKQYLELSSILIFQLNLSDSSQQEESDFKSENIISFHHKYFCQLFYFTVSLVIA